MNPDPLAEIATPEAVAAWLRDCGLGDLAEPFRARGWYADGLLDADEVALATIAGPERLALLRRLLAPLRALRYANRMVLTRAERDQPAVACRALGRDWAAQPGLATLLETWPSPIAHELHMLGELLAQGKVVGALMQMRDAAEVLIKVPAVILARDLLEHGAAPAVQTRIRQAFFTTSLSMGTWLGLARDLAQIEIAATDIEGKLLASEVAALFVRPKGKGKPTPFYAALDAQTARRNWDLGHGALRIDEAEIVETLRHYLLGDLPRERWQALGLDAVTPLAAGLAYGLSVACWDRLVLTLEAPAGERPLIGWRSIRDQHQGTPPPHHEEHTAAVLAVREDRPGTLRLAPYLAARTCDLCGHQDVFVFNGWNRRHRYDLLDYLTGHRMWRNWDRVPDLHREAWRQPLPAGTEPPAAAGYDLRRGSVVALLDDAAFDKRYLSPQYLRRPLKALLTDTERGVFWLQAPGHVGKSMFVLGLAEAATLLDEQPLLEKLKVVAVFIRKEYRYGPEALAALLEDGLTRALDLRKDQRLPRLDLDAADRPGALVDLLQAFLEKRPDFDGKLLLCLDGLDELRPPEGDISLLDFVPPPERLPVNTYILLTSRPRADHGCPLWVWQRLGERLEGRAGFRAHAVSADDPDYHQLLRRYVDRELGGARAVLETRLAEAGTPPAVAKEAATTRFERLFAAVVAKAEGLFLHVAFLIDRIKEGELPLDEAEIEALPAREALFGAYLNGLDAELGPKHADLAKWVLLVLAALERAHAWYIDGREPPYAVEDTWRGVPLETLITLLHRQGAEGELMYLLLCRLRAALGSWRGEAARETRYRLGLKGLGAAIEAHETLGPALQATHARLAREALAWLVPAPATDTGAESANVEAVNEPSPSAVDPLLLRYALAHGVLSGDAGLAAAVTENDALVDNLRERFDRASQDTRLNAAVRWSTLEVLIRTRRVAAGGGDKEENALAAAYGNRGNPRSDGNDLTGALADLGQAITLMEGLRARLGDECPPAWAEDLAAAYMNRGATRSDRNDLTGALADYDQAITLLEELLLSRWDEQCSAAWLNILATAYMNRGTARGDGNDLTGALADYDRAIALQGELRSRLADEWPPAFANDLATTYMNRGNGRRADNDLDGALADYGEAIALREGLRSRLGDEWPLAWAYELAKTHMDCGVTRHDGNDLTGALADYHEAIALMEALRSRLGDQWPPAWAHELAKTYMNRGVTRHEGNDLTGALADYGDAIPLMEALRSRLDDQWPPAWANDLANAYVNRGVTHQSGNDLTAALTDYDQAIALKEELRVRLADQWPPAWAQELVTAYMIRGRTHRAHSDRSGALADYDEAIALGEELRAQLGEQWRPAWASNLAEVYRNRGDARDVSTDLTAALADYNQAIALIERLRLRLGNKFPPAWSHNLVKGYISRGITRTSGNNLTGALLDYSGAITLMEELRSRLGEQWSPSLTHYLAKAYSNRGGARLAGSDLTGALIDFGETITLMEGLRAHLGDQWPPVWAHDLAKVYAIRGDARRVSNDLTAALADYGSTVSLMEWLRTSLGEKLPPAWSNDLAEAYMNRSFARYAKNDLTGAVADYDQAIELGMFSLKTSGFPRHS